MHHKKLNFELLNSLFRYCPKTGRFFRKANNGRKVKTGAIATSKRENGYLMVQLMINGYKHNYRAHRVAWLLYYGIDPGEFEIDHIDQDKTNNRISNLRLVDHGEQQRNRPKPKNNTSGITGVSWEKDKKRWRAHIGIDGERRKLGTFKDKFEAICCRKSAEKRLGFHENHGK